MTFSNSLKQGSANSLAGQWLGLCALTGKGLGLIPGRGTKIPQAARHSQILKKQTENNNNNKKTKDPEDHASLVAQWLRICLPMQGTRVWALVWEDPTCHGATKPVCHNYWAHVPQLPKPAHLEPVLHSKRSHCKWEAHAPQPRVAPAQRN